MRDDLTVIRQLIDAAACAGVSAVLCRKAADAVVNLADQPAPDRRRVETLERGRRINQLRAQRLTPAEIRERLNLTVDEVKYADRVVRECHTIGGAGFPEPNKETAYMDLKSSSITTGAMSTLMPKAPHAKPAAPADVTPRDNGGLATGTTGGNFTTTKVSDKQVAPGVAK